MRGQHREPRTEVGKLLRENRLRSKLTMKQLAEHLDVTLQFISNIEGGITPVPFYKYKTLMRVLNIYADDIVHALKKDLEDKFYEAIEDNY